MPDVLSRLQKRAECFVYCLLGRKSSGDIGCQKHQIRARIELLKVFAAHAATEHVSGVFGPKFVALSRVLFHLRILLAPFEWLFAR